MPLSWNDVCWCGAQSAACPVRCIPLPWNDVCLCGAQSAVCPARCSHLFCGLCPHAPTGVSAQKRAPVVPPLCLPTGGSGTRCRRISFSVKLWRPPPPHAGAFGESWLRDHSVLMHQSPSRRRVWLCRTPTESRGLGIPSLLLRKLCSHCWKNKTCRFSWRLPQSSQIHHPHQGQVACQRGLGFPAARRCW